MATKPSELLSRLPSASELLEKPPIRALANRWNRSVVAAGVRSFLDELRSDLERRAADVNLPSLRELAERAARHVAALQQTSIRPTINATGRLLGPDWAAVPLADSALEQIVAVASGFVSGEGGSSPGDAAELVSKLTGAEAATVVQSYSAAVWIALAALPGGREVVIARSDVGDVDRGVTLAATAKAARAKLREVGSVNRSTPADYEAAVCKQTAAIWRHVPDDYRIAGDTQSAERESLVGLARDCEVLLLESLGAAALVPDLPALDTGTVSVAASLAAGVHLAIVRGNGLVGGPACGILAGTRSAIDRIESHPLFPGLRAAPTTLAALAATLRLYGDPQQLQQTLPICQLLGASVENLRQRAERLAPQLARAADVESALAVASENCVGISRLDGQRMPSFAVALTPVGEARALENRLRNAAVSVLGKVDGDRLLLDLRSVLPRQDQVLVEAVVHGLEAKNSEQSVREMTPGAVSFEPAGLGERS